MRLISRGPGHYPGWMICLMMANGDPLRAKQIFDENDATWHNRWIAFQNEMQERKSKAR